MTSERVLTVELRHFRSPGRAVSTIDGWLESDPEHLIGLVLEGKFDLSTLDPRIEGTAATPSVTPGDTRSALLVSGPVTVEGRELGLGDRVRIIRGGKITWGT